LVPSNNGRSGHVSDRSDRPALEFASELPPLRVLQRDVAGSADSWASPEFVEFNSVRSAAVGASELGARVRDIWWYHTIELPGGVVTSGEYDHRPLVPSYGIPEDLTGQRVLDVATFDGFWAFEFERRGADVVAVDIDSWAELDLPAGAREIIQGRPPTRTGAGFRLAAEALGSKVERVTSNVYDLDPARLGTFDLVHVGDLLLHLRDPVRALERVRSMTAGTALICDSVDVELPEPADRHLIEYLGGWNLGTWWMPSVHTLGQMIVDAGFSSVSLKSMYRLDTAFSHGVWRAIFRAQP
jgi:tRNA (mo5U34)-methyltransferase